MGFCLFGIAPEIRILGFKLLLFYTD